MQEQGREALTIAAVCSRAGVTPTTIYRRVDGISGLFWAIYESAGSRVRATLERNLASTQKFAEGTPERVRAVVEAIAGTFHEHEKFIHQIVNYSTMDETMSDRGSLESRQSVRAMTLLLSVSNEVAAQDIARYLHQECTFRAMYGDTWLSSEPETYRDFVARLIRVAEARLFSA